MEQLSFSQKPDEKLFFLGALGGLAKIGAAKQLEEPVQEPLYLELKKLQL